MFATHPGADERERDLQTMAGAGGGFTGDAEYAERRHLGDDAVRDQRVGKVPLVRVGRDRRGCEAAHLITHLIERIVAQALVWPHAIGQQRGPR